MAIRNAEAEWTGGLKGGNGQLALGSGACRGPYSFVSRFEEGAGTNPEELIGAAHAGCFSMALAAALDKAGHAPRRIATRARVHLEKQGEGFSITRIDLITEGEVPGIDDAEFVRFAQDAKANCPVSRALAGPAISLEAKLK